MITFFNTGTKKIDKNVLKPSNFPLTIGEKIDIVFSNINDKNDFFVNLVSMKGSIFEDIFNFIFFK